MSINSFLLSYPIPVDSIGLGRLVTDPKYPDQDFIQPSFNEISKETASLQSSNPDDTSFTPDIATQKFQDVSEILEHAQGTRLELNLLNILSFATSKPPQNTSTNFTKISSTTCIVRKLRNTGEYFAAACQQPLVRDWLQRKSRRYRNNIYMVCGFRTLADAKIEQASKREAGLDISVNVPATLIAGAAGVPLLAPTMDLDLGGSLATESNSNEKVKYTAAGEQVFTVQYRRVRVSRFSAKKVDSAYLEQGNRWYSFLQSRASQAEDDENVDVVEAELAQSLEPEDLVGQHEKLILGDEEMIFRVDDSYEAMGTP
ncbi:hypothetical protein F5Y13DRAFT_198321 [Hypoxylon sp. FL1857]|nr:hypothetical protein F5Y13DRAFT_198321 [Hypoxylon sp. FL1857]